MVSRQIDLGLEVEDKITGFTGIAVSKVEYINGCIQFCVQPKMKTSDKGCRPDIAYIDEGQLIVIGEGVDIKPNPTEPGGEMSNTPSGTYSINQ